MTLHKPHFQVHLGKMLLLVNDCLTDHILDLRKTFLESISCAFASKYVAPINQFSLLLSGISHFIPIVSLKLSLLLR